MTIYKNGLKISHFDKNRKFQGQIQMPAYHIYTLIEKSI
jgi:hypothetical protein